MSPAWSFLVAVATIAWAPRASAQACCAGSSVVTPGRLGLHEVALVGVDARASALVGSFDPSGDSHGRAPGSVEDDFEEDLFGSLRVLRHGQVALLVPFVETLRRAPGVTDAGGGIGDLNLSARWDFLYAGQSRYVPGIALLAGVTFPTGRPVEPGTGPLGAGATGVGAFQFNGGLSLEQSFGPWLVDLFGIVAARTPFSMDGVTDALSPQFTGLASLAYVTASEIALALSASLTYEGDPVINGTTVPDSEKLTPAVAAGFVFPIGDHWRFQTAASWNPPLLGKNTLATAGLTWTLVRSWF